MDCGPRVENTKEPIHAVGKRSSPLKARSGSMARLRMIFKRVKWQGCWRTLAEHNKAVSLAFQGLGNPWIIPSLHKLERDQASIVYFLMEASLNKESFDNQCRNLPV